MAMTDTPRAWRGLMHATAGVLVALLVCPLAGVRAADEDIEGDVDRELLKKLREHLKAKDRDDPLARAADRMRKVQTRLDKGDSGKETREMQTQVVKDLEEAIKRMQQQVKPPKNQKQQKKTKKVLSKVPQPRPKPGTKPKPQAGRKPANKTGKGKPQPATRRPPMHEKAEDWGFLPDFLRDEVLQRFKEGYLQEYRDLLEQYYIRLSEKGKGG